MHWRVKQIGVHAGHGLQRVVFLTVGAVVEGVQFDTAKADGSKGCCDDRAQLRVLFNSAALNDDLGVWTW